MGLSATNGDALAVGFTFPILGAIAIFTRFYMRRRRGNALLADDWMCIPAFVGLLGVCITMIYAVERNVLLNKDKPTKPTITEDQRVFARITGVIPIFWLVGLASVKFSILFFYRRIFMGTTFNWISWGLIGFNALWAIYAFFTDLFYCGTHIYSNFEGSWLACPENNQNIETATYIWDALIDLLLILLPIPFVMMLQMAKQRKFELVIAFVIGGLALVASLINTVLQLQSMLKPASEKHMKDPNSEDATLYYFYWQAIELGVGVIACNLPTLQPLYNFALVHSWTAAVAAKRSISSLRSNPASAFSRSRSRKGSMPLSSQTGHSNDQSSKQFEMKRIDSGTGAGSPERYEETHNAKHYNKEMNSLEQV